jgi:hypothetical protein
VEWPKTRPNVPKSLWINFPSGNFFYLSRQGIKGAADYKNRLEEIKRLVNENLQNSQQSNPYLQANFIRKKLSELTSLDRLTENVGQEFPVPSLMKMAVWNAIPLSF